MARVSLRNLQKSYEKFTAVRGIDLEIDDHEFIVLVGPSGCGKSTTLRMIAGLEEITGGELWIGDRMVNAIGPGDRDIAMVFQNYALYPHMTVRNNISFGLRQRHMPKAEIDTLVDDAARILGIEALLERKPRALSGGQRQRVAMGRAIVRKPQVFLFDEPLSNLDAKLRVQMRTEIKKLHQAIPTTTVYVTHDQIEAMTMADRVVVMNDGRVEQVGSPQQLYAAPASRFVAGFIGSPAMNFFDVVVEGEGGELFVRLRDGARLPVPASRQALYAPFSNRRMLLGLRPEVLDVPARQPNGAPLTAKVSLIEPLGGETLVYFTVGDAEGCARLGPETGLYPGETIQLTADMARMHLFDPDTNQAVMPR